MDIQKDYYTILGILPNSEIHIIEAVYKALIKIYHPDKSNFPQAECHQKTVELNEAYSVLSNKQKREKYDKEINKQNYKSESEKINNVFSHIDNDWNTIIKYQPDLTDIINELSKVSSILSFNYKIKMMETKDFENKINLAKKIENEYLDLYFGSNYQIKEFA